MKRSLVQKFIDNPKLMSHLMENSYYIKDLNRDPNSIKIFEKKMKELYKERPTDKVSNVIDGIDMISSVIDTLK